MIPKDIFTMSDSSSTMKLGQKSKWDKKLAEWFLDVGKFSQDGSREKLGKRGDALMHAHPFPNASDRGMGEMPQPDVGSSSSCMQHEGWKG